MKSDNEKYFIDADTLRRRLENPTIRKAFLTLIAKKIGEIGRASCRERV